MRTQRCSRAHEPAHAGIILSARAPNGKTSTAQLLSNPLAHFSRAYLQEVDRSKKMAFASEQETRRSDSDCG
ncbi:hypothetical protein NDU88_002701 [Pleurodeles waltl]|uniref:Uncharacterized protein n=1 Tax=Pleurodeles waltl TaxID=8319 RepID=A0AAV7KSU2_PLEWA|nr:hypothetical protein NDU88_002701 [Pleurodeles waltl]